MPFSQKKLEGSTIKTIIDFTGGKSVVSQGILGLGGSYQQGFWHFVWYVSFVCIEIHFKQPSFLIYNYVFQFGHWEVNNRLKLSRFSILSYLF